RHSHGHWRKPLAGRATAFNGKPGPGASRWRAGTAFGASGDQSFARAQSGQYPSIARDQHGRTCADFHVGSGVAHEPSLWTGTGVAKRVNLSATLKESGRGLVTGHHRLGNLLVIVEFALSLVLAVSAGLLIRSFVRVQQVAPGF